MQLIITDLTEMQGGNFCVAGWDTERGVMVRPLPDGHHWSSTLLAANKIAPGAIIDVQPNGRRHQSQLPHSNEDYEIAVGSITNTGSTFSDWFGRTAPHCEKTVDAAFGATVLHNKIWDGVRQSAHVLEGTDCRSLWGCELTSRQIRFVENFGKLKAIISDRNGRYQMAVAGARLKKYHKNKGLSGLNSVFITPRRLHLRLGLARPFEDQKDKCYCLLNDVFW